MNKDYDNLLHIDTSNRGIETEKSSQYNHYESTPYTFLYTLFQQYELKETDELVDFGCGKGRILFYVHDRFGAAVTGIERNRQLYKKTIENRATYLNGKDAIRNPIRINCCLAEDYEVKESENIFYLFNPFSVDIFKKVVGNILASLKQKPRYIDIILYYPTIEYIKYLKSETPFELFKEVKIPGLSKVNKNERFLIYRTSTVHHLN